MKNISDIQKKCLENIETNGWNEYYKNKSNQVPRETLVKALEFIREKKKNEKDLYAIDMGCGHGADTIELLKNGWNVLAIDGDKNGIKLLNESVDDSFKKNLRTEVISFEEFESKDLKKCDLLNASFSLPFCKPEHFKVLWDNILNSIKKGGVFSGQLFGENDEWAYNKNMTFLNIKSVHKLFGNFNMIFFEEKDEDGKTASGDPKHWHVFSVIAEKLN
ncbi:MAG TPA: class I SAM-dependent methyltransferase [Ignavibacteria bacterium]|nr:class I SAM-dependent methyltransferase [Ignavibacteria bacterium]HMR40414.1 class I SAM-dependent methyltransferase [Ignavibacteria bacterium]